MLELVQLERRHADFAQRNTRIIAISIEGTDDAKLTQAELPHLVILADQSRGFTDMAEVIHPHAGPDGGDAATPTTILVDSKGKVRWLFRPSQVLERLSPDEVLAAIDEHLGSRP